MLDSIRQLRVADCTRVALFSIHGSVAVLGLGEGREGGEVGHAGRID